MAEQSLPKTYQLDSQFTSFKRFSIFQNRSKMFWITLKQKVQNISSISKEKIGRSSFKTNEFESFSRFEFQESVQASLKKTSVISDIQRSYTHITFQFWYQMIQNTLINLRNYQTGFSGSNINFFFGKVIMEQGGGHRFNLTFNNFILKTKP